MCAVGFWEEMDGRGGRRQGIWYYVLLGWYSASLKAADLEGGGQD